MHFTNLAKFDGNLKCQNIGEIRGNFFAEHRQLFAMRTKLSEIDPFSHAGMSSFPARHEISVVFPIYLVPSYVKARTQYL